MYIKKKKKNLEKPRQAVLIFGANYKLWNEIPGRMKDVFKRKLIYDYPRQTGLP